MKLLKLLAVAGGTVLVIIVLLTLALRIMFPPARLRRLVQDELRKQIHREAQIGPVQLGLWGITLERLKLSDVPDFSAGTFLYVEKAHIHWALTPLLHRSVVIQDILLQSPQMNLVRRADGKTFNITDLQAAATQPSSPSEKRPKPLNGMASNSPAAWSWKISNIRLKDGSVNFSDLSPANQTTTLSKIELTLEDLSPSHTQGQLSVAHIDNTVYTAQDFQLDWQIQDLDPQLAHLNGWIRLRQGPGTIQNLSKLAGSSKSAKLVFLPIVMLQNLEQVGLVNLGLPDFSHWPINGIVGDYQFQNGTMSIQKFTISSRQLTVDALGTVELASGKLAVDVAMQAPQRTLVGELDLKMHISGTLSNPRTDLDSLKKKAFKATLKNVLQNPKTANDINKALKSLFH